MLPRTNKSNKMEVPENCLENQEQIMEFWFKLKGSNSKSLLKKHLTEEIVDKLKWRKTKLGATLMDVIKSGVVNLDSNCGIYGPDVESYETFRELFEPVIEDYHGFGPSARQPATEWGGNNLAQMKELDPEHKYIISTRIRCGRNLKEYPFNPMLSIDDYLDIEQKVKKATENFVDSDLQGAYYPLDGMSKLVQNQLIADHYLFKEGDRFRQAANGCRFMPKGRGIFFNNQKTFFMWICEGDHMRFISMQRGGNVAEVLERLSRAVETIEKELQFSRDDRLGYMTCCPTNLGTSVRASVHVKLPNLSAREDFKEICDKMKLQIRGIDGEHSDSEEGVYDISNKQRMGFTEFDLVKLMYDGVKKLIEMEEGYSEKIAKCDEITAKNEKSDGCGEEYDR